MSKYVGPNIDAKHVFGPAIEALSAKAGSGAKLGRDLCGKQEPKDQIATSGAKLADQAKAEGGDRYKHRSRIRR